MTRVPMMLCIPHRVPECPQRMKGKKMAGKCEHGLTLAECFTCASPKYGDFRWRTPEQAVREALEHEVSELRKALEFIATHFSSDWPERCQSNVLTARKALTHGMGPNVRANRETTR